MKIYAVKVSDIKEDKLNELCLLVDEEKKNKIKKFINKKDKIRSLIAEILIRTIIIENLKINNKYIKFNKKKHGKPYLENYSNFNFNISHSGEYVLCGIDDKDIGVDVEEIKNINIIEIAQNYFTTKEFEYIINCDVEFQLNRFYEMWTLKESYIKCSGQGLSIPLASFSVEVDKYKNIKVVRNNEYEEHTFKLFDIDLDYKLAVCSLNGKIPNNIMMLDQDELINKYIKFSY